VSRDPLARRRLLVGVSGSIAAYKSVYLVRRLVEAGARVDVVLTAAAARFVTPLTFETVAGGPVLADLFAGPPNAHIALAEAADAAVVAPTTADLIARHAHGLADDALATVLLAVRGPVLMAPAMDGGMWDHPATRANVAALQARGVRFVGPEAGPLASGLTGVGRMAEPEAILAALADMLEAGARASRGNPAGAPASGGNLAATPAGGDLSGEHVLVGAGPTREWLDPVRFLSNPSTGRMGFAVAAAAARRGARVTLVAGPVELPTPPGCARVDVETAAEMRDAVHARLGDATVLVMAAAVSDFRPTTRHPAKVKKERAETTVALERTEDILAGTAGRGPAGLIRVGFAAETGDPAEAARRKLKDKDLDLIVANDVSEPGAGFGTDTNRVILIGRDGAAEALATRPKGEVAEAILDRVAALRARSPRRS
jgi:phosphopantothenoylcysteine decarboxylase/phosphopantothenate--cysteine ligase